MAVGVVKTREQLQREFTDFKNKRKALIDSGVYVYVLDDEVVALTSETTNTLLDFKVIYLDTGYDRDMSYTAKNWRLATKKEIVQAQRMRRNPTWRTD